ncbi:chloroplastic import inner membrane translocase subunit HP30-2-like [Rutidosis leptorrhynchoides]|uniref:chloroplastic import inner membrane translocase subunit HP30-2-like n=1 Tax=Rutidosis leptorrhynchoides TaxID=125765 RepID=UPI003A9A4E2D
MQMLEKLIIRYFPLIWKKKKKENKKKEENDFVAVNNNNNPFTHLAKTYKECESSFNNWVAQRSLPVEAAITTVTDAERGRASNQNAATVVCNLQVATMVKLHVIKCDERIINNMTSWPSSLAPYQVIISGGTLEVARNFAVLTSVDAGISHVMQKIRGKKDAKTW